MTLKISIPAGIDAVLPDPRKIAEAAALGVMEKVKGHLEARSQRTSRPAGFPKSNYWADAADSVDVVGNIVEVVKEGAALHYFGGVLYPREAKALAIPERGDAYGKRPKEYDPSREALALIWPKGESTGRLVEKESGETVYMLVDHATIQADPTVLPTDEELMDAAKTFAMEAFR